MLLGREIVNLTQLVGKEILHGHRFVIMAAFTNKND
jgi:hypothetical protein